VGKSNGCYNITEKDSADNRKVIIKANQSKQKEIRNVYKSFNSAIANLYSQYSQKEYG